MSCKSGRGRREERESPAMRMKDELRATLAQPLKLKGPNKPTGALAVESRYFDGVPPAGTKVDCPVKCEGARQLEDYTVSPNGRDKIGRVLSYLRQITVDSVFNESLNIVAGENSTSSPLTNHEI